MKPFLSFLFLVILSFSTSFSQGQTTKISGLLKSSKGETIPGANVYIKGTYDGTSSSINGEFNFETSEKGSHLLVVSAIGFKTLEKDLICEGKPLQLGLELKTAIDVLNAVNITAGAMEASDEKRSVVIKPLDIVTTAGALGSVEGALSTLPGTATVGNDGRLFVRGGDASETAIFFDGLRVGNAYGTSTAGVPTRSRFNPILFKGTFFSTGGYSAEYGQALSSALVLNTIDEPIRDQTDISLMTVGGSLSHTKVFEKQSITGTLNYTDLKPYQAIVPQNFDWERAPNNFSGELLYRNKYSKYGLLKAFVSHQNAGFNIWQKGIDQTNRGSNIDIHNSYNFANLSLKDKLGKKWTIDAGAAYSGNTDQINIDSLQIKRKTDLVHLKLKGNYFATDRFRLVSGLEGISHQYSESLIKEDLSRDYKDHLFSAFTEGDYYFSDQFVFRGGIRLEHNSLNSQFHISPRASAAYKFSPESQMSLAYGNFYQPQAKEKKVLVNDLHDARATHFIANYQFSKKGYTFRFEAFHKDYNNLISTTNQETNTSGDGFAQGFDLFYRDNATFKGWDYWVTYSFVNSQRKYGNYTTAIQPSFAPNHSASIVAKKFVNKLNSQIGGSWSWNDGLTYDNPNLAGEQESRAKDYSNLSLSWSYLPKPNLIIHFACTNVLGRENVFGYQYSNQANGDGKFASAPILQGAKRFFFIGVFFTLSKDKTANQLNNL